MIKKGKEPDQDAGKAGSKEAESGVANNQGNGKGHTEDMGLPEDQDIPMLRQQLQTEISRLQEQFKRQKIMEKKLEEEQKKLRLETEKLALKRQEPYSMYPTGTGIPSGNVEVAGKSGSDTAESKPGTGLQPSAGAYELFEKIESELQELKLKMEQKADEEYVNQIIAQNEQLTKINEKFAEFKNMITSTQKEYKKVEQKLNEVLEDIGYEESMDIGKVPPDILELVYETIIEDVIKRIKHDLGVHDTEVAINQTLEEIRFRTSGSELFKYEGGKLKLRNLSKYIQQKSVSAKQIHTTFNELLSKLVEKVPDYEPKNFKAMIKIKSQEYSLDKVMGISDRFKNIEKEFKNVDGQIGKLNKDLKELDHTNSMIMNEFKGFNLRVTDLAKRVDAALNVSTKDQPSVKPPSEKKSSEKSETSKEDDVKSKEVKKDVKKVDGDVESGGKDEDTKPKSEKKPTENSKKSPEIIKKDNK